MASLNIVGFGGQGAAVERNRVSMPPLRLQQGRQLDIRLGVVRHLLQSLVVLQRSVAQSALSFQVLSAADGHVGHDLLQILSTNLAGGGQPFVTTPLHHRG